MAARHTPHATYLSGIVAAHRASAASDVRDPDALQTQASSCPPPRGFIRALIDSSPDAAVIAEIKRRSPSKGELAPDLDPAVLASEYERGGAGCLSVLTDEQFFGGSVSDLTIARDSCSLPVLRKDFTVCGSDVADARIMGADAVLLIVAALSAEELRVADQHLGVSRAGPRWWRYTTSIEVGVGALSSTELIGVNQRNLANFEVDTDLAVTRGIDSGQRRSHRRVRHPWSR